MTSNRLLEKTINPDPETNITGLALLHGRLHTSPAMKTDSHREADGSQPSTIMPVPLMSPLRSFEEQDEEILTTVQSVLKSGAWVYSREGQALESELSAFLGVDRTSVVASGTDALLLALQALGVKPGDEVITPAYSFFASASVISLCGAKPVFCDVDEHTFNIDPDAVEAAITNKTVGIIAVHLYGLPANMPRLMEIAAKHHIFLLEDACQAIGSGIKGKKTGSFGELSAFSFYPTKNLAACGEGGAVAGRDADKVEIVSKLRAHGETKRYFHSLLGRNSRLDEVQSAILRIKLRKLNEWTARRREIASRYTDAWADLPLRVPFVPEGYEHVYHLYVIQTRDRDRLKQHLDKLGIGNGIYYPVPLPHLEIFKDMGNKPGQFPVAEQLIREVLTVPVFPQLSEDEIERVLGAMTGFFGGLG
jgi:dTDP-4-amino-4,6-dideoxygalactose transaminase